MDLGSEIQDPEKTYSGSRIQGQKGTGSRIRIRNTGSCIARRKEVKTQTYGNGLRPRMAYIL
jgi:hypothetical protein